MKATLRILRTHKAFPCRAHSANVFLEKQASSLPMALTIKNRKYTYYALAALPQLVQQVVFGEGCCREAAADVQERGQAALQGRGRGGKGRALTGVSVASCGCTG